MAQVARTYSSHAHARPQRVQRPARPDVRVVPGRRSQNPAYRSLSEGRVRTAFLIMAFAVVLLLVFCVRITFSAATVSALQANEALETQLSAAQAQSNELEIQRSILSSPDRIKSSAEALGMGAAESTTYLTVETAGIVTKNAAGQISLAQTIGNIVNSAR